MRRRVLITGGAGFIGSHLVDELLHAGYEVRVLDNLRSQVHGHTGQPGRLRNDVELRVGDVLDHEAVRKSLHGVDAVVHLAAHVGVGQSMYQVVEYTRVNSLGTAILLEAIDEHPVEKLVLASSMSIYGEGLYRTTDGRECLPRARTRDQLARRREWNPCGPAGEALVPAPTPESKRPEPLSVYALSKHNQERLCLLFGSTRGLPVVALRLFNVYGPCQALSNPYTGVLAAFAARLLNEKSPLIYEDGKQLRDFVHVRDAALAFRAALARDTADGHAVNVGSGQSIAVREIAEQLSRQLGLDITPQLLGTARGGDVRHCFADISLAREMLAFQPEVSLPDGIAEFAAWLDGQLPIDRVENADRELFDRGLII